jgi:hypothetical protein
MNPLASPHMPTAIFLSFPSFQVDAEGMIHIKGFADIFSQ